MEIIIIFFPLKILLLSSYKHGNNKGKVRVIRLYKITSLTITKCHNLVLSREEPFHVCFG